VVLVVYLAQETVVLAELVFLDPLVVGAVVLVVLAEAVFGHITQIAVIMLGKVAMGATGAMGVQVEIALPVVSESREDLPVVPRAKTVVMAESDRQSLL